MGGYGMGGGGMGGFGARRLGQTMFGGGINGAGTAATPSVRTTLTLGFQPPAVSSQQASSAIAEHLEALPALHWVSPPRVDMQGRTAILRGAVATEHDRDLAALVVRLEPTVYQVENQIVVAGPAAAK